LHFNLCMTVAFDISRYPIFRDGDLYYPGIASVLAILHCGGTAILFSSAGVVTRQEERLIDCLTRRFTGQIIFAQDAAGADMCVD